MTYTRAEIQARAIATVNAIKLGDPRGQRVVVVLSRKTNIPTTLVYKMIQDLAQ